MTEWSKKDIQRQANAGMRAVKKRMEYEQEHMKLSRLFAINMNSHQKMRCLMCLMCY